MGNAARKIVRVDRPRTSPKITKPPTALVGGGSGGSAPQDPWSKLGPYLCKLYRQWEADREIEGPCADSE